MLCVGLISDVKQPFSSLLSSNSKVFHFNFAVAHPTFSSIFDSAMSPPARFIEEMYLRLRLVGQDFPSCRTFIFNPFFDFSKLEIAATLRKIPRRSENAVLTDRKGKPIGYYFGCGLPDESAHLLRLLSTVDGSLDASLISQLFCIKTAVQQVSAVEVQPFKSNGFIHSNSAVFKWLSERSLILLKQGLNPSPHNLLAIMPHHAGDVLFASLAFRWTDTPVEALAVNNSYESIAQRIAPNRSIVSLPGHAYFREPNASSTPRLTEWDHFLSIKDKLPGDKFCIYMRPSRDYNRTTLHLIDHYAFAFGRHMFDDEGSLVRGVPAVQRLPRRSTELCALIHLDAGWPLKIYPVENQQKLIDEFTRAGFKVTALVGKSPSTLTGCEIAKFVSLETLSDLLSKQSIVIGMDSFPAHWASFALGVPTITVFGSTRKENSRPHINSESVSLDRGLRCCPCLAWNTCPSFGGEVCQNFPDVTELVERAHKVIASAFDGGPKASHEHIMAQRAPRPDFAGVAYNLPSKFITLKLLLHRMVTSRYGYLISQLARRFFDQCRATGILPTLMITLRFLVRRLHGIRHRL